MITELPSHVKVIVSTIPNHGNLLALISKLITKKLTQTYLTADSPSNLVDEMIENQILRVKQLGLLFYAKYLNLFIYNYIYKRKI